MSSDTKINAASLVGPSVKRCDYIVKLCQGKDVLDLGCVRHKASVVLANPNCLHTRLRACAASVTGVDIVSDEVAAAKAAGWNVKCADVTTPMDLQHGPFDVIVAGDLIEHLDNFAAFFLNCRRYLKAEGVLVLSTPNPFFSGLYHYVALKSDYCVNPEHTCLLGPQCLVQLAGRQGFDVETIRFCNDGWRLAWIITQTRRNRYDIFANTWPDNRFVARLWRWGIGMVFNVAFRVTTCCESRFVRHSDYLAVLRVKND